MLHVLDTTVLIDYLRGRPAVSRVEALRRSSDQVATTAINVEEIVRGLRASEAGAATQLLRGLVVLPVTSEAGWQSGVWRRDHARRGVTLWQADCLIAAVTLTSGARLATGNPKDFPMIEVDHWPVGE